MPGASPGLINFLREGATTREEVILQLGQPSASFEHERILTYRLGEVRRAGLYLISPTNTLPWADVRYSLVLIFDGSGRLERKGLVTVH